MLGGCAGARADTNADTFIAHQVATRTFTADLKETFHWSLPRRHVESVGRIYYRAPDFLAMILTNPVAETVLVRGPDLYIKRGPRPLVHRTLRDRDGKPTQNVQFLLAFFQNGCTNYTHLFNARVAQTNDSMIVTLLPKHFGQMFPLRKVTNVLGWPTLDVRSMRIGLIMDSYINYEFSHVVRNQAVDATVFDIPKP